MRKIFLAMMLLATFIFAGCNTQAAVNKEVKAANDELKISMLNIGHGDAILIRTKEQTILIDTADNSEHEKLVRELEKFSVTKINKLILTHPHADHIGGARMLIKPTEKQLAAYPYLEKISVEKVFDNGIPFTNAPYKAYMKAIEATKTPRQGLKVGDVLDFGGGVDFKVLWPTGEYVAEMNGGKVDSGDRVYKMNNSSVVGKLTYKNFSMMFTGDCEKESEEKILAANDAKDLKCDILKAGHHGSKNSSSKIFVKAVNPEYILITAGNKEENDNAKGTPHLKLLERFSELGIDPKKIFCTRWNGTITVTTDGKNFSVTPEVRQDWVDKWMTKKRSTGAI